MKNLLSIVAVTLILTACGTTAPPPVAVQQPAPQSYAAVASMQQNAVINAPEWMSKLPKSANAIYENGTATSSDFGMADMKAKTMAYAKICTSAGGKVRSQMKMFKSDTGESSMESTELAVRSMCADVDITGVETVEMRHVSEGNRIRSYVLIALPIGGSNVLKTNKDAVKRAPDAFKELDEQVEPKSTVKNVDVVGTTNGDLKLLDVQNMEYKTRRAEALEKPNAVIGQTTLH
jgi:hypothetical protein